MASTLNYICFSKKNIFDQLWFFLYKNSSVDILSNVLNEMFTKHLKLFWSHSVPNIYVLYQKFSITNYILKSIFTTFVNNLKYKYMVLNYNINFCLKSTNLSRN